MKNVYIDRFFRNDFTVSNLFVEDEKTGLFILEDKVREIKNSPVSCWKIPKKTAIPSGKYFVCWTYSKKFKKILPELRNVSGFEGVRIHTGNNSEDTEGCLIIGEDWDYKNDWLYISVDAFEKFKSIVKMDNFLLTIPFFEK